jgi:hypothetical protein
MQCPANVHFGFGTRVGDNLSWPVAQDLFGVDGLICIHARAPRLHAAFLKRRRLNGLQPSPPFDGMHADAEPLGGVLAPAPCGPLARRLALALRRAFGCVVLRAAISQTEAVARLASVVEAERARLVALGERRHVISELGVALLVEEASDVEAPSPSARFARLSVR